MNPAGPPDPRRPSADGHETLRALLGAWALDACPRGEAALLEEHLGHCGPCADEAARLRDAAGWLSADEPLDPAPALRGQVLDNCLGLRAARVRMPSWAAPLSAETARLDALLRDLGEGEWLERAEAPWHGGVEVWRPAEVLCHLAASDGYLGRALGLDDPFTTPGPALGHTAGAARGGATVLPFARRPATYDDSPWEALLARTQRLIGTYGSRDPRQVRALWREQTRALVQAAATADEHLEVDYETFRIPLRDAFVDRAFECWMHAEDIARAVDYPYEPPAARHVRQMVDLAARMLPAVLEWLRQIGHAEQAVSGGAARLPGGGGARTLRLVVEGPGAGEWLIPLDGPTPPPGATPTATLIIDGLEFCHLAAAHRDPDRIPTGRHGDQAAIREVLHALPLMSRP